MTTTRRLSCIAGAAALAISIVGCGREATPAPSATSSAASAAAGTTTPAPAVPPPLSDDDQIRQAINAVQDAYNTQNWVAYKELICPKMAESFNGPVMEMLKKTRADNGLTQVIAISNIVITEPNATAQLDAQSEVSGRQSVTMKLARDQDGWKVCMLS